MIRIENEFHLYFKGKLKIFSPELDFREGTQFEIRVWKKLLTIPYGKTRSYQWLANAIGKPKTYRAVGNANGKNPIPLIVPCHRVIQKNGNLGGYTGGTNLKEYLLNLENNFYATI